MCFWIYGFNKKNNWSLSENMFVFLDPTLTCCWTRQGQKDHACVGLLALLGCCEKWMGSTSPKLIFWVWMKWCLEVQILPALEYDHINQHVFHAPIWLHETSVCHLCHSFFAVSPFLLPYRLLTLRVEPTKLQYGSGPTIFGPTTRPWWNNYYPLVMTNSSPWKDPPFLIGKPSISMGHVPDHLYHGYVSQNQRVHTSGKSLLKPSKSSPWTANRPESSGHAWEIQQEFSRNRENFHNLGGWKFKEIPEKSPQKLGKSPSLKRLSRWTFRRSPIKSIN